MLRIFVRFLALFVLFSGSLGAAFAQGGEGAISGTVTDPTGAIVPGAKVVAHNIATGVDSTRTTTGDGVYNVAPLVPGTYTLTVTATGFSGFRQENIQVNALANVGLNVALKVGNQSETVTITDAPPVIETTNATLGGTIDNKLYTALPIMITGLQQRDITQFSNLLPGAQVPPGGRSSIIGGTGQRLGELYVDGLPITTLSQQGDNRPVFNIVPLEAIDQVKVVTSGFSAEYQGAGLENYNTKSGGNKYHGSIFGYFRNTIFDAWTFSTKPGAPGNQKTVVVNGVATKVDGPKTPEHQVETGFAVGGPIKIPHLIDGHDKLFFFATYDKFHSSQGVNPSASTIPTMLMRQGNFQELLTANATTGGKGNTAGVNYPVYDPSTQASCTAHSTTGPCRYQYGYGPGTGNGAAGNPVLVTPGGANIIPASQLSPITQFMQKYLPAPTIDSTGTITNNYLGGVPQGYDNWMYSGRIDYIVSPKQTLIMVVTGGNRHAVPYTSTTTNLPVPYLATTMSTVAGHWASLEDNYVISGNLVNQFKYGFMNFGGPPVRNITQGNPLYSATAAGITGLPAGQASENFPNTSFSGSNAPAAWVGNTPTTTNVSETYTLKDNLSWLHSAHSFNFGFQYQWLENNSSVADGASQPMTLTWSTNETANLSGTSYATNTGYSYSSFMIGAVGSSSITQQAFSVLGGRFHPWAVYGQDDWKIRKDLTLNIGLRYDYLPTYREVQDRWSFLNPNIQNPVTGNMGALQFAGNRAGGLPVSCNCSTPVDTHKTNFGPRFGLAWTINDKTVVRGGFGLLYSHAGGTGGAGGAGTGTGQFGFTSAVSLADSTAGPAFYLNRANSNWGGPGYVLPAPATITATSQTLGTGYYVCSGQNFTPCNGASGTSAGNGSGLSYPDKYLGGRAPVFNFWNFGLQREITSSITVTANYVGSQSHFLAGAGNIRGLQSGQVPASYLASVGAADCSQTPGTTAFNSCLNLPATTANLALAQARSGVALAAPYSGYTAAAAVNSNATIAHMLTWMPQYSGTSDPWGNVANANYHAFQLSVSHRAAHGLTLNVNYTYSKNIDDAGTARSGWDLPAAVTSTGKAWKQNAIDRSLSINSQPQNLSVFGVYELPFGRGKIGGNNFLVRALLGGWQTGDIFQYSSGIALPIVGSCNTQQNIGQGTCMPDYNPAFTGSVRTSDGWGKGVTAATLGTKSYLNGYISTTNSGVGAGSVACASSTGPFCNAGNAKIGNLTRVGAYGLRGPSIYRLTSNVRRSFDFNDRVKFIFGVDCQNVTNHTTFGNNAANSQIGVNVNSSTFGTLNFASADSRAFQFSGRLTF
ncbi:TonB-dependent receptor [Terriglobus albidus]|uniref:TonB-dependent receptor n=1 Tax=Terriglobus albidus TaxID=1592106 RepID=UPI0021DF8CD2|nr:TonB-dependent receptor [Terriglobus albidus]